MKTKNELETLPKMTTRKLRQKSSASISNSRWVAYATAGAATALAGVSSAEADIHYSGPINQTFNASPGSTAQAYFQLDQPGDSIIPFHYRTSSGTLGRAQFKIFDLAFGAGSIAGFRGGNTSNSRYQYASKLASGVNLNGLANFVISNGSLASRNGYPNSQWTQIGTGFVGFRFHSGSDLLYGWARIHMDEGTPGNSFTLIDFAWADLGDQIATGQVPEPGSLALLALGGAGLLAWRKRRAAKTLVA